MTTWPMTQRQRRYIAVLQSKLDVAVVIDDDPNTLTSVQADQIIKQLLQIKKEAQKMARRQRVNINRPGRDKPVHVSAAERAVWAREQWVRDSSISVMGNNGMHARLMEIFGKSMPYEDLNAIREEARQERIKGKFKLDNPVIAPEKAAVLRAVPEPAPESIPAPEPVKEEPMAKKNTATTPPEEVQRRIEFARVLITENPEINSSQIRERIRTKFGGGLDTYVIARLRNEITGYQMGKQNRPSKERVPTAKPGTGRGRKDSAIRKDFARMIAAEKPDMIAVDLVAAVKAEYGYGIDTEAACEILRRARGLKKYEHQKANAAPPVAAPRTPAPPVAKPSQASTAADAIRAALTLLLDEVPSLKTLNLSIDDKGKPHVEWTVYEVSAGKIEL